MRDLREQPALRRSRPGLTASAPPQNECRQDREHVAGDRPRAHARSGDRIAIAAYIGKSDAFELAMADFSAAYADQNERDYERLQAAVKKGRIKAETGR